MRQIVDNTLRSVVAAAALTFVSGGLWADTDTSADGYSVLILFMTVTGDSHYVDQARITTLPEPLQASTPSTAAFTFELTDAAGTVLGRGSFEDPRIRRGALPRSNEAGGPHAVMSADTAQYVLRMAHSPTARYLHISAATTSAGASASGATSSQRIDLAPFIVGR